MKRFLMFFLLVLCLTLGSLSFAESSVINLPKPIINGNFSLDKALKERRSIRDYTSQQLSLQQISQLFWAADGISDSKKKFRTAPSAWATYPLNLYLVNADGVWQYNVEEHSLKKIASGDRRQQLRKACLGQKQITKAPILIVITMLKNKIPNKMGLNGKRFSLLEAGHIAQNILLESVSLGLVSGPMTGFVDQDVRSSLAIPNDQEAVYVIPVGYKK